MNKQILSLRMKRQHLLCRATSAEYEALYRDLQPGYNIYWNGFGDPPSLTYRADFDDIEYNRTRQVRRDLIKLRLNGGNLGWLMPDDLELFAALYRKPLTKFTERQLTLLEIINREGPMNIQYMKELSGMLVKEITPALHRLQEAFLIYEDQPDGEWDRGWYKFSEMFPSVDFEKYSRISALKSVLQRFAYRIVCFDSKMAKSYYKLPEKEINVALEELISEGILIRNEFGYILKSDEELLINQPDHLEPSVFAIHKNDFLYRSYEYLLKDKYKRAEWETLYYILIDGEFCGACYGKFRYGPPDFDDIRIDLPDEETLARKDEILSAVHVLSFGKSPERFNGAYWLCITPMI